MKYGHTQLFNQLFLIAFFAIPLLPGNAQARDALRFGVAMGERMEQIIERYAREKAGPAHQKLEIARADLNEDGLDEIVLREKGCAQTKKLCNYNILAVSGEDVVEIAAFSAHNAALGSGYTAGIRNIMVFSKDNNDYEHDLYVWEPGESRYIQKTTEQTGAP